MPSPFPPTSLSLLSKLKEAGDDLPWQVSWKRFLVYWWKRDGRHEVWEVLHGGRVSPVALGVSCDAGLPRGSLPECLDQAAAAVVAGSGLYLSWLTVHSAAGMSSRGPT